MGRVPTTNYSAEPDTQFQWATAGTDPFSRLLDLYRLAIALEKHDHSNDGGNRGLAVRRIANNVVTTAVLQDNAVTESKIANGAVTNTKLGPNAVTYDKILWPLVQSANSMDGGIKLREISNTYAFGVYVATNGLVSLGAGNVPTPRTNLILGQNGEVSVGTTSGPAKFNVMQTGNAIGSGIRAYNPNTAFYTDLYNDANGDGCLAYNGAPTLYINHGRVCISPNGGGAKNYSGRMNTLQASPSASEGNWVIYGSGFNASWVDADGDAILQSAGTIIRLEHEVASLSPWVNGGYSLGRAGLAWGPLHCGAITCTSITTGGGSLTLSGPITGVTNLSMSGQLSGNTGIFSGGVTCVGMNAQSGNVNGAAAGFTGSVTCVGVNAQSGSVSGAGLSISGGASLGSATIGNLTVSSNLDAGPVNASMNTLRLATGTTGYYLVVGNDQVAIPSGGSWKAGSDLRLKEVSRDYDHGLAEIRALRPVYYEYNGRYGWPAHEREYVGLVAQEVLPHIPEMVGEALGLIDPNDPDQGEETYYTTDPGVLTYALIKAVQELATRLEALEATSA